MAEPFTCHPFSTRLAPIPGGWALAQIARFDTEHPGFLRFMLAASPLRRQGVFFTLAQALDANIDRLVEALSAVAREKAPSSLSSHGALAFYLCSLRVRRIIQAIYCECPSGLLTVLAKVGPNPLTEEKYALIFRILNDPSERARADLLRSQPKVTDLLLDVLERLPSDLLHPGVLRMCNLPSAITRVEAAVAIASSLNPGVERAEIVTSLADMGEKGLVGFIEHWLDRSERLVIGVPPVKSDRLRCLATAAALRDASKRYKNCLKHKIGEVALEHAVFFELSTDDPKQGAIAEVTPLSGGLFSLTGIHGYHNERPPRDAVVAILEEMTAAGVLLPAWVEHDDKRFAVRKTLCLWEFRDHGTLDPRECRVEEGDSHEEPSVRFDPEEAGLVRVA